MPKQPKRAGILPKGVSHLSREVYILYRDIQDEIIKLNSPADFVEHYKPLMAASLEEQVIIAFLADDNTLLGERRWTGNLETVHLPIGEIIRTALLLGSNWIVAGHNHPTAQPPIPSDQDLKSFAMLGLQGELLGIHLLDAFVFNSTGLVVSALQVITEENSMSKPSPSKLSH